MKSLVVAGVALLLLSGGCGPWAARTDSVDACSAGAPGFTTYDAEPTIVGGWWYVADEEPAGADPDDGASPTGDAPSDDTPVADPEETDATDTEEPGAPSVDGTGDDSSDSGGEGTGTLAVRLRPDLGGTHAASFRPGACWRCIVACTMPQSGVAQPRAVSTNGASALSQDAACADAERRLKQYASASYGSGLDACGVVSGAAQGAIAPAAR